MSAFSRITGVFFEPAKTFEDIGRSPSWFLPLLLIVLGGLAFSYALGSQVGWDQVVAQRNLASPKAAEMGERQLQALPEEQRQAAKERQVKLITPIFAYAGSVVGPPIGKLIAAAVLLLMCSMMSAGLRFKQIFAIVCFAGMPGILQNILKIVVVFLKKQETNVMNPLAFNPAAFMDMATTPKFLYYASIGLDVFEIWVLVLVAIGLKAAAGKKLSMGGAVVAVFVPWALLLVIGAGIGSMFS